MKRATGTFAGVCLLAAGCSGGGDGGSAEVNAFCHTIAGPGSSVQCTVTGNQQQIDCPPTFDGHFASSSNLTISSTALITGTANRQVGGSVAGVFFRMPSNGSMSVTITTLLNGTQQETMAPASHSGGTDNCSAPQDCEFHDGAMSFVGLETTMDYDAIQASITNSGISSSEIHELCVR